jgi:hypothetical protein
MRIFRRSEAFDVRFVVTEAGDAATSLKTVFASTAGMYFEVLPHYLEPILTLIDDVRSEIAQAKTDGRFIAYLSVPISPKGGGHFDTNNAIAKATADAIETRFGRRVKVINSAAFNLPTVGERPPGGGEYMAVWSDVIAGRDGKGDEFDMIYFVGPTDVWSYFGLAGAGLIDQLEGWIDRKASEEPDFKKFIETANNRSLFVRYYALRGSVAYSKGAHDEWNIVAALNARRAIGDDIAVYFEAIQSSPAITTISSIRVIASVEPSRRSCC